MLQGHGMIPHWHIGDPCIQNSKKCWEDHHGKVLMDSAFASNMYEFIIQSSQNVPITEGRQAMLLGQQATSCRQVAEWGMQGLQGLFPRLKDRIIYEENGGKAIILKFITLLYNYRVQKVGINQILNHYMPLLSTDVRYLLGVQCATYRYDFTSCILVFTEE